MSLIGEKFKPLRSSLPEKYSLHYIQDVHIDILSQNRFKFLQQLSQHCIMFSFIVTSGLRHYYNIFEPLQQFFNIRHFGVNVLMLTFGELDHGCDIVTYIFQSDDQDGNRESSVNDLEDDSDNTTDDKGLMQDLMNDNLSVFELFDKYNFDIDINPPRVESLNFRS